MAVRFCTSVPDAPKTLQALTAVTSGGELSGALLFQSCPLGAVAGPGTQAVSLSLLKNIRITERVRLRLGAAANNAFNHPNYGSPAPTLGQSTFGIISSLQSAEGAAPRPLQMTGGSRSNRVVRIPIRTLAVLLYAATCATRVWGANTLVGRWLLQSQEVSGHKTNPDPLTLRIIPSGNSLDFAYSLPVDNIQFVSLRFTARLDGSPADVKDAEGRKIGSVTVMKTSATGYRVVLTGPNRPTSYGMMTLSADGSTLVCESDAKAANGAQTHTVQVFARQR